MLDADAIQLYNEAVSDGRVIDAMSLGATIIPWGSACCYGCEMYQCGKSITAHGYCPVLMRRVSPHFYCDDWEQD